MSQTYDPPILDSETLSDSLPKINDAYDALKTTFIGTADPTGDFADGLKWVNTTSGKVKARIGGATVELGDWAAQFGHIRKDGTVAFTGNQAMGGFKLTGLGAPSAGTADAARISDVETRVPIAGGTITGAIAIDDTSKITANNHLASLDKIAGKVNKAGDTLTGRITYTTASPDSPGAAGILSKQEVENLTSFNTSAGHRHTGSDGRKVRVIHLDATGVTTNAMTRAVSNALEFFVPVSPIVISTETSVLVSTVTHTGAANGSPIDSGWITVATGQSADALYAILSLSITCQSNQSGTTGTASLSLRKPSTTPTLPQTQPVVSPGTDSGELQQAVLVTFVELNASRQFDYRFLTSASGTAGAVVNATYTIRLIGYVQAPSVGNAV